MLTIGSHIAAGRIALMADLPKKKKGCKCGCPGNCEAKKAIAKLIHAYGTSEGAVSGWDTRGRGRKALDKAGFKQIGARQKGVTTFTMREKRNEGASYHHRIDVKDDGSWRHVKGPYDMAIGRVHGKDVNSLMEHLGSGKHLTSYRNQGTFKRGWEDFPEAR